MIKKLAKIKEEQGQIAEAADLMQEVAVSGFLHDFITLEYLWHLDENSWYILAVR